MNDYLDQGKVAAKNIVTSRTFQANTVAILASVVGAQWPAVGDFIKAHGLELFGLLAGANIGLRAKTKEPVTFSISKKF